MSEVNILHYIPNHVGIIMDGNNRNAKLHNLDKLVSYAKGAQKAIEVTEWFLEFKIKNLSLYAFSLENWSRPQNEVDIIFSTFLKYLRLNQQKLINNNIKVHFVGFFDNLNEELVLEIKNIVLMTKNNTKMNLYLVFNYGGRQEIVDMCQKIFISTVENLNLDNFSVNPRGGNLDLQKINLSKFINLETVQKNMLSPEMPPMDLLIRTSNRQRISNFLLWHIAYAEIYISKVLWPEFSKSDLEEALKFYVNQERTFGSRKE